MSIHLTTKDIDRLGPAAKAQVQAALAADAHSGPRSDDLPRDNAGVVPEEKNAPARLQEGGLPSRAVRRRKKVEPTRPRKLAWLVAVVRAHPWPSALAGVVLVAGGIIFGVLASEPRMQVAREVMARCDLNGQITMEPTIADCRRLIQALTAKGRAVATSPLASAQQAPEAPQTSQPSSVAAQSAPQRQESKAPETTSPAPNPASKVAPSPKAAAQPAPAPSAQQPKEAQPTQPQPEVTVTPNVPETYCVHFSPQGATTTDGPCGQAPAQTQGQGAAGISPGLHKFLCRVEKRTDGFCG